MEIQVTNLKKQFGNKHNQVDILNGININFESGKIYGLVGENGSGKSVFLKILCGLYKPTEGKVIVHGEDIFKCKVFPKDTRALIEKPSFIPELTGLENLEILASIQKKITKDQIIETLKKVNLGNDMNKKFGKYSLGMKQKLGIAQVLMEDPKIMILDEPFNGIDKNSAQKIRELLLEEKKRGKLIILATHIHDDIESLVDDIYEFVEGKIIRVDKNETKSR